MSLHELKVSNFYVRISAGKFAHRINYQRDKAMMPIKFDVPTILPTVLTTGIMVGIQKYVKHFKCEKLDLLNQSSYPQIITLISIACISFKIVGMTALLTDLINKKDQFNGPELSDLSQDEIDYLVKI